MDSDIQQQDTSNDKVLRITCQGATTVDIDDLHDLQGKLKDLSKENYLKLKKSMLQYGFSFPIFMWIDTDGKKWIIDAHQRTRTLKTMRQEGYTIPPLPADIIQAESRVEAKKKLLLLNSGYGTMTQEGFNEFIYEPEFEISIPDIEPLLALPADISLHDMEDKAKETKYRIIIECASEEEQIATNNKLAGMGYNCRTVTK